MPMYAAIAGAALGGIGSVMEGYGAQSAIKKQNREARKLDQQARDWNYARFLESRGQGGYAFLPLYAPTGAETNLINNALGTYSAERAAAGTPAEQIARYQSAVDAMTPAMNAADTTVNQIFNGQLTEEEVSNLQPVIQARAGVAGAQKQGVLEALQSRLNALSAKRALQGYQGGGSTFERSALKSAAIPALQAAATVGAQADLASAMDVAGVKNAGVARRVASLGLPVSQAASRIQLSQLPATAATADELQRQALLNWFKMQPQAFAWNHVPQTSASPNDLMIWGSALKSAGKAVGEFGQPSGAPSE